MVHDRWCQIDDVHRIGAAGTRSESAALDQQHG
jgi:hypothetical protein